MSSNAFFSDLLSSISERGRTLLRRVGSSEDKPDGAGLIALHVAGAIKHALLRDGTLSRMLPWGVLQK